MDKQILKNQLKQQAKSLAWRAITTVILTLTAVITVWAYAAFVEPTAGPNNSDQDFAQNILGNNDANNDFSSSNVVSNADGSIIERQEYIQTGIGTSTDAASMSTSLFSGQQYIVDNMDQSVSVRMISAISAGTYNLPNAVNYCRDLSAACAYTVDGSACPAGTFTDWRLPTAGELSLFLFLSTGEWVWTHSICLFDASSRYWMMLYLGGGFFVYRAPTSLESVRCVR